MRVEVQVNAPAPRRAVVARPAMPREQLERISGALADSPLKTELERIARHSNRTRSKT